MKKVLLLTSDNTDIPSVRTLLLQKGFKPEDILTQPAASIPPPKFPIIISKNSVGKVVALTGVPTSIVEAFMRKTVKVIEKRGCPSFFKQQSTGDRRPLKFKGLQRQCNIISCPTEIFQ